MTSHDDGSRVSYAAGGHAGQGNESFCYWVDFNTLGRLGSPDGCVSISTRWLVGRPIGSWSSNTPRPSVGDWVRISDGDIQVWAQVVEQIESSEHWEVRPEFQSETWVELVAATLPVTLSAVTS